MVGRPKGSRNRAGHKAGGYRSNAGNISNDERKRRNEEEKAQKKRQEERRAEQQEAERERRLRIENDRRPQVTTPFSTMHDSCNDETKSDRIEGGPDEDIDEDMLIYDEYDGIEIDEDDKYAPRNRQKHDLFHKFQELPMGMRDEHRFFVSRLLIHATFEFDIDDKDQIYCYLRRSKPHLFLSSSEVDVDVKLMEHFYHNREWWRQHCLMYTPKAVDHARSDLHY